MATKRERSANDSEGIEQYDAATAGGGAGDVIEFDPDAPQALASGVESFAGDVDTIEPSADLLQARDALEAQLGGLEAFAAAAVRAADAGESGLENIVGVGVGAKISGGGFTGELAVKVYVREKMPLSRIHAASVVPQDVEGCPTDVEEVGEIVALTYAARYPRPVPCGVSCGHVRITAGTLGCLVVLNNNRLCILSNNHVLANQNNARPGDTIIQPGRVDGGQAPRDRIGVLERFVPIHFPGPNVVDAAAAWTSFALVRPQHVTYRMNPRPLGASIFMSVLKNGRTTQATVGNVTGIHVNGVRVGYNGGVAVFNDQLVIQGIGGRPFSQGGDSGSVIVSAGTRQPVGLLFAGSATHTIANPIGAVMSQLGIGRFVGGV